MRALTLGQFGDVQPEPQPQRTCCVSLQVLDDEPHTLRRHRMGPYRLMDELVSVGPRHPKGARLHPMDSRRVGQNFRESSNVIKCATSARFGDMWFSMKSDSV